LAGKTPVAVLRHNGECAVLRPGQEAWGVVVKSIAGDSVVLTMGKRSHVLRK
jgi:hypothetical protein